MFRVVKVFGRGPSVAVVQRMVGQKQGLVARGLSTNAIRSGNAVNELMSMLHPKSEVVVTEVKQPRAEDNLMNNLQMPTTAFNSSYVEESELSEADKVLRVVAWAQAAAHGEEDSRQGSLAAQRNESLFAEYTFEANEMIKAVRMGRISGIPASDLKECPKCSSIYKETLAGSRTLSSLPTGCGVRIAWVSAWARNHDSMPVYESDSMSDTGHGLVVVSDHHDPEDLDENHIKHQMAAAKAVECHCSKETAEEAAHAEMVIRRKSRTATVRSLHGSMNRSL